jgi:hypothetical protein
MARAHFDRGGEDICPRNMHALVYELLVLHDTPKVRYIDPKALISSVTPFEGAISAWEKTGRREGIKNIIEGVRE